MLLGKQHQSRLALACLLARGHLLIEDLPGMGKTTLSHALATTLGLSYQRLQFTSDMLPADVIGVTIFDQSSQEFEFKTGPIFTQLLLADEINRTSPKTQSALLEAMEERQVSVDGVSYKLPEPFFVVATQNPMHQSGTFVLPESQLDRFMMCISLGFPDKDAERQLLKHASQEKRWHQSTTQLNTDELLQLQLAVDEIVVSDTLLNYVLALLNESRSGEYPNPLSPRAGKALVQAAKAWALIENRRFVLPDDLQAVFSSVAEHRLRPGKGGAWKESASYSQALLSRIEPFSPE